MSMDDKLNDDGSLLEDVVWGGGVGPTTESDRHTINIQNRILTTEMSLFALQ